MSQLPPAQVSLQVPLDAHENLQLPAAQPALTETDAEPDALVLDEPDAEPLLPEPEDGSTFVAAPLVVPVASEPEPELVVLEPDDPVLDVDDADSGGGPS